MPWVRLNDALFRDPTVAALPDYKTRYAYLAIATAGSEMTPAGEWPSRSVMKATMPGWVTDAVPALITAGLLGETGGTGERVRVLDRSFYPSETPDAERMRRRRMANGSPNGSGTVPRTHSLSSSLSSSSENADATSRAPAREGMTGDWWTAAADIEALTGQAYGLVPYSKMGERVVALLAKHGADQVRVAMARAASQAGPMPTVAQVIFGAGNALDPIPREPSRAEQEQAEADARNARELRRTQAYIAEMRRLADA